ncbi:MAG: RluA family pseudouridine synthase [Verrucomicrobiales bacterium]|nr:RluA family pseudouridine synthase [Verrucomicrobiales bacterium]
MLRILHEDLDLLVVNKPAGLVCHPTKGDALSSLISRLRLHHGGPGVILVNRLDRETSGITVAAKNREAAAELGRLFESRAVHKCYRAIVHGHPATDDFRVEVRLGKHPDSPVAIQDAVVAEGVESATEFRVLRRFERCAARFAVVQAIPWTGRKHQIRIHLAHAGWPIVGDKIYGGDPTRYLRFVRGEGTPADASALLLKNQALHAERLEFSWRGRDWRFEASPEEEFLDFVGSEDPTAVL